MSLLLNWWFAVAFLTPALTMLGFCYLIHTHDKRRR